MTVFDVVAWFCTELSARGADTLSLCQMFLQRVENATDKDLRPRKVAFLVNRINLNEGVPRCYMKMRADPQQAVSAQAASTDSRLLGAVSGHFVEFKQFAKEGIVQVWPCNRDSFGQLMLVILFGDADNGSTIKYMSQE